jgi:hypothetical protein
VTLPKIEFWLQEVNVIAEKDILKTRLPKIVYNVILNVAGVSKLQVIVLPVKETEYSPKIQLNNVFAQEDYLMTPLILNVKNVTLNVRPVSLTLLIVLLVSE